MVCVTIIHKQGLTISFGKFVVKALPFAVVQLILALAYVLIFVV